MLIVQKRIATSVILNSIPLATNPNGALLLTWLVDQSNLPGRYGLLANRFAAHMAHLCTHKLASLTVLRIISQNSEPSASLALTAAIFESAQDTTLFEVLQDANNGPNVISKILAVSSVTTMTKDIMYEAVKRVLPMIKASVTPPYRSLLEMVGLPVPAAPVNGHMGYRAPSRGSWSGSPGPSYSAAFAGQPGQAAYPAYGQPPYYAMPNLNGFGLGGAMGYGGLGAQGAAALSPLLMPHNLPLGASSRGPDRRDSSSSLGGGGRGRGQMGLGRMHPAPPTQMMSPASDPFNPFASPSIDFPYHPGLMAAAAASLPSPHLHAHAHAGQGMGFGRGGGGGGAGRQSSLSQMLGAGAGAGAAAGGHVQGAYQQIPSVGAGLGIMPVDGADERSGGENTGGGGGGY